MRLVAQTGVISIHGRYLKESAISCLGYESCFVNLALALGPLYRDLPYLWVNVSNLQLFVTIITKKFRKRGI